MTQGGTEGAAVAAGPAPAGTPAAGSAAGDGSAWAPLRRGAFRWLWLGVVISGVGTTTQTVGALPAPPGRGAGLRAAGGDHRQTRRLSARGAACAPGVEHRRHKGLNNRAENSHRPTRRREWVLQRFKSPAHAQQFLAPFGPISDHFGPRRHLLPAPTYHQLLQTRFVAWRDVTGVAAA